MKKMILLLVCLTLCLCACGSPEQVEVPQTTTAQTEPAETQAPETQTTETQPQETEAVAVETEAPTEAQNALLDLAKTCIDKSVEELYDLVGEPESSDYAPSCLGDGEDGNLYYDGFIVYTYREGNTETVRYVE